MDNLADRFEISATRWARAIEAVERAYPIPKASLDAEARMGLSLDRERDAVAHAGVRLLAGQAITSVQLDVFELQETCESPIEMPMVLALMTVARHEGVSVKLIAHGREYRDRFEPSGSTRWPDFVLRIEPQAQLGEHRVDFCLTLDGSIRAEDGRLRSGSKRMVIECDGHEFHERTKVQAPSETASATDSCSRSASSSTGRLPEGWSIVRVGGRVVRSRTAPVMPLAGRLHLCTACLGGTKVLGDESNRPPDAAQTRIAP